jgi:hypothetical protein
MLWREGAGSLPETLERRAHRAARHTHDAVGQRIHFEDEKHGAGHSVRSIEVQATQVVLARGPAQQR